MRFTALSLVASALSPRAISSFYTPSLLSRRLGVAVPFSRSFFTTWIPPPAAAAADKQALLNCPVIPLRDGTRHPAIGFGTYKVGFIPSSASAAAASGDTAVERSAQECVRDALDVGYRFLECAQFYGNEAQVGKAIQASGIPRDRALSV